jgi:hypothetical protein
MRRSRWRLEAEKTVFLEKKNQKTFTNLAAASPRKPRPKIQKFFASFFQKRSPFLLVFYYVDNLKGNHVWILATPGHRRQNGGALSSRA